MSLRTADARRWRIGVIDGPNMPNLGARDRDLYGPIGSLAELEAFVARVAAEIGVEVTAFASNFEGEILEFIHGRAADTDGYLINPAGLTRSSPCSHA
jgi:3-dehydroquinate dehydratase-2